MEDFPLADDRTQSNRNSHTEIENTASGKFEVVRENDEHEKGTTTVKLCP